MKIYLDINEIVEGELVFNLDKNSYWILTGDYIGSDEKEGQMWVSYVLNTESFIKL